MLNIVVRTGEVAFFCNMTKAVRIVLKSGYTYTARFKTQAQSDQYAEELLKEMDHAVVLRADNPVEDVC